MAKLFNIAKEYVTSSGTGPIKLGGAVEGWISFADAGVNIGDLVAYCVDTGRQKEHGVGTYDGATLTRSPTNSTNGGGLIYISPQEDSRPEVYISPRWQDLLSFDQAQTFTAPQQAQAQANLGITIGAKTIVGTANEITVTNGSGAGGNPTISLPAALTFTGKTVTGGTFSGAAVTGGTINNTSIGGTTPSTGAFTSVTATTPIAISSGGTGANTDSGARTALGLAIGSNVQAWDPDLDALAAFSGVGVAVRTGTGTWAQRTFAGTGNEITVTNGDGVAGAPVISLPASLTFSGKTITGGTFTGASVTNLPAPSANGDAATKAYVDAVAVGQLPHTPCAAATNGVLSGTPTYSNGASGVGATLTAASNGALTVDSYVAQNGDRILVKNQASGLQNGIYTVTDKGSAGTPYILTRATDADQGAVGELNAGLYVLIMSGTTYTGAGFVLSTTGTITVGTTAIVFTQTSATAGVAAFNGRNGVVVPTSGDYIITQLGATTANRLFGSDGSGNSGLITLGTGLSLAGSALTNSGTLSVGGVAGALTLSSGLSMVGSVLTLATGTSGHNLPFLDGGNTWSGAQTFSGGLTTSTDASAITTLGRYNSGYPWSLIGLNSTSSGFEFRDSPGNPLFNIKATGNVGIGTTSPSTALQVAGTVTATSFAGSGAALTGITAAAAGSTGQVQFNSGTNTMAADSNLKWDNTNKWLGIGTNPTVPLDVVQSGAAIFNQFGSTAVAARFLSGSSGSPITTANSPSVFISRYENITSGGGDGSTGPALYVTSSGAGVQQNVAITGYAYGTSTHTGDVVGLYGTSIQDGVGPRGAFGGFFAAWGRAAGTAALAIETETANGTGADVLYDPTLTAPTVMLGIDLVYDSTNGTFDGGPAILARSGVGKWDVILAVPITPRTAIIMAPLVTLTANGRLVAAGATDDGGTIIQAKGGSFGGSAVWTGYNSSGTVTSVIRSTGGYESAINSYGTISDRSLKSNIVDASPKLEKFMLVQHRSYDLQGVDEKQIGVIADELAQIFPSLVYEIDGISRVKASILHGPILGQAFQEHVRETRARLAAIDAKLASLARAA